jgi:hypothetical protein
MKGREELTMDGNTRVTWVLGPSRDPRQTRPQRIAAGIRERNETVHGSALAVMDKPVAEGSNPRLVGTRHVRIPL